MEELIQALKEYNKLRKDDNTGPYFLLISQTGKVELVSFLPGFRSYSESIGTVSSIKGLAIKLSEIVSQLTKLAEQKIDVKKYLWPE